MTVEYTDMLQKKVLRGDERAFFWMKGEKYPMKNLKIDATQMLNFER